MYKHLLLLEIEFQAWPLEGIIAGWASGEGSEEVVGDFDSWVLAVLTGELGDSNCCITVGVTLRYSRSICAVKRSERGVSWNS